MPSNDHDHLSRPASDPALAKARIGARAIARRVFVAGCGVSAGWKQAPRFTIVELGTGSVLNFLETWACWRDDPQRSARLHFVCIAERLPSRDQLAATHQALGLDDEASRSLHEAWPPGTPGLHRLDFDSGSVTLTLAVGPVSRMLSRLRVAADSFYLDELAPESTSPAVLLPIAKALARIARPGASLACPTATPRLLDALHAAGFESQSRLETADARHALAAVYRPRWRSHPPVEQAPAWPRRSAVVVGAGLAGCAVALALSRRGWRITLLEAGSELAGGGSCQPMIADHLHLSPDDNPLARLTRSALFAAGSYSRSAAVSTSGRLQLAVSAREQDEQHRCVEALNFPPSVVAALDAVSASVHAGRALKSPGLWMPGCRSARPRALCHSWLEQGGDAIELRLDQPVAGIVRRDNDWIACDAEGAPIVAAPLLVLANAGDACRLGGLDERLLRRVRGQSTIVEANILGRLTTVLGGDAYVCPSPDGELLVGSTFDDGDSLAPSRDADQSNLRRLARMLMNDGDAHEQQQLAEQTLEHARSGPVGFRYVARDRLPLIGRMPDLEQIVAQAPNLRRNDRLTLPRRTGLYGAFGFGSRGLLWSSLAAEIIAADVEGEPPPIESDLLDAVDPCRFTRQEIRRGQFKPVPKR